MPWEIGLQVLEFDNNTYTFKPRSASVYLYKSHGFYYEQYRDGVTNLDPGVNGVFDVLYCNVQGTITHDSLWYPITPGTYYLRIDNYYCYFTFINPDCNQGYGSPDVTIKYTYGQFTLLNTTWAVSSISQTYPWNEIDANFQQLKSDGVTPVGTVALGQGSSFSPRFTAPYDFYLNKNQPYLFHADTNIISSQKYFQYQNITNVTNFSTQNVGTQNYNVTAMFNPIYTPITIKNYFLESSSTSAGNIYFKRSWLIDYKDPNYGYSRRNRGMDGAIFVSRSSPFYPDTRYYGGNSYRGIFLNQGGPPLWIPPYYSIQAPQSIDFGGTLGTRNVYLQNWSSDPSNNASFEDANASETGVVFTSTSSTTIKANLKVSHLSNDASAFSNNSQRKLIETQSGGITWLHQVYTSIGARLGRTL